MMQHGPLLDEVLSMPGAESSMMVTQQESWLVTYQNSWYEERHQLREYLHGIGTAHQGSQVRPWKVLFPKEKHGCPCDEC